MSNYYDCFNYDNNNNIIIMLNSSPIDELGNWCLKGWSQNPQRFAKQQIRKDQLKNASVRCNVSHKISKRPLRTPLRSRTLEEETADRIGLQFNFA